MTASYEALKQSAKAFMLVKRPGFAHNRVDSVALPLRLVR